MKLELNHIQHYPIGENGLKWTIQELYTVTMAGITPEKLYTNEGSVLIWPKHPDLPQALFPILHPLSDYKDVNSKAMNELNCDVMDMIRISELANQQIGLSSVQYGVIEIMCDNHIDFNRLIESGLAIDIKTL